MPSIQASDLRMHLVVRNNDDYQSKCVLEILRDFCKVPSMKLEVSTISPTAPCPEGLIPVFVHDGPFTRETGNGTRIRRKSSCHLRAGTTESVLADLHIKDKSWFATVPACIAVRKINPQQCVHADMNSLKDALHNAVRNIRKLMRRHADKAARDSGTPSKRKLRAAAFRARRATKD